MVDSAYPLLRVSPWQCLTSSVMIGSPSPSHPTVRSVFPSTAVRQPSSQSMRRGTGVSNPPAANVRNSHGIEASVRVLLPPEPPAFPSIGKIPPKARVDEALSGSKGLARIGVPIIIDPPFDGLVDLPHKRIGRHR